MTNELRSGLYEIKALGFLIVAIQMWERALPVAIAMLLIGAANTIAAFAFSKVEEK